VLRLAPRQRAFHRASHMRNSLPGAPGWRSGIPCAASVSAPAGVPIEVPRAGRELLSELLSELGFGLRAGQPSYRVRPFVAFDQRIQLTAVGEVIFRASAIKPRGPIARKPAVFSSRQTSDCGPAPLAGCRHINHGRARAECLGRSWRSGAGTRRGHEGLAWPRLGEAPRTPA
jgi:hypothetical protein